MAQVKKEKGGVNVSRIMSLVFAVVAFALGMIFVCATQMTATSDYKEHCAAIESFTDDEKFFCEDLTSQIEAGRQETETATAIILFVFAALFIVRGLEKR